MSHLFYDHYLDLSPIEKKLKALPLTHLQTQKLWQAVDSLAFHHVLNVILTNLPQKHHHRFLRRLHQKPHSPSVIAFLEKHSAQELKSQFSQASLLITTEVLTILEG